MPIPMSKLGHFQCHQHAKHVLPSYWCQSRCQWLGCVQRHRCRTCLPMRGCPARFLKLGTINAHGWHRYAIQHRCWYRLLQRPPHSACHPQQLPMGCSMAAMRPTPPMVPPPVRSWRPMNGSLMTAGQPISSPPIGECPSGYFEVPSPYGQSQCITPSDTACADQSLNAACSFSAGGISVEGVCSNLLGPLACLATCSPDDGSNYPDSNETSCVNTNSVCQATGMLGDAATLGVCIPANRFQAASDCPGGSFAVDNGDGTFDCIPPSGIGCNIEDATDNGAVDLSTTGSTCSFSHGGHALIGVCSGSTPGLRSVSSAAAH